MGIETILILGGALALGVANAVFARWSCIRMELIPRARKVAKPRR